MNNKNTIIFVHGMFLTGKSWEHWLPFFAQRGYECLAPSWPLHDGEPSELRANVPPGTGELSLDHLVDHFAAVARGQANKPILIGHSLGGLVAQKLVERDLAAAAVCISSVAPNAMLSFDWSFFKNAAQIANPIKGDSPFEMTEEGFYANFCNTMTKEENARAYHRYAVHESRNVLRDAMGKAGRIDLDRPHAPLLFIAAENDAIIPDKLNRKNAEAYKDKNSRSDFREFAGRGHFICGQAGWEEIAEYAATWLERSAKPAATSASASATGVGQPSRVTG